VELGTEVGPAWLAIKVWARSSDDAADLVRAIAPQLGAEVQGRVDVYSAEPVQPPGVGPLAYDPAFTSYAE
jgi:hypothetical protein